MQLPETYKTLVIRTDYSDQKKWEAVRDKLLAPTPDYGYIAEVEIVDDVAFQDMPVETIIELTSKDYIFLFVVDNTTIAHPEQPILCVEFDGEIKSFRLIPAEFVGVENNLAIANMDFEEFSESVDADGIFRGFQH